MKVEQSKSYINRRGNLVVIADDSVGPLIYLGHEYTHGRILTATLYTMMGWPLGVTNGDDALTLSLAHETDMTVADTDPRLSLCQACQKMGMSIKSGDVVRSKLDDWFYHVQKVKYNTYSNNKVGHTWLYVEKIANGSFSILVGDVDRLQACDFTPTGFTFKKTTTGDSP